ncbi:MAG: SpoIVB peptidase S55 domain-containing protein [Acidobacteriota bacterium]
MPLGEVRPGMVGVGRTVFEGDRLDTFQVHILGVLHNVVGPRRSLVLARLEGGPLAHTGVIAGMSGSPVYVDGKLLGAVSYALGLFSKEPIAGITPIAEMTDATALETAPRGTRAVAVSWPPAPGDLLRIWARDLGLSRPFADDPAELLVASGGVDAARTGALLRPIAVPLVTAGFHPDALAVVEPLFARSGMVLASAPGGQLPAASSPSAPLRPGDAVGVSLMGGDFVLGATGTVTHVDGDRVYAFGHPMYNLGPTAFPMTRAAVHVVLPSLQQSVKLASFGDVVGTIQQDRATAVAGRLGPGPAVIPVDITLNSDRAATRQFTFTVVKDPTFTPLLTYLAVANVLTSYERGAGPASFTVRGSASIHRHGDIAFEDIFTGDQPAGGAAAYVAGPLTLLLRNGADPVDVEKITLTIDATEESRAARIERVWLDTERPRPGDTVVVKVLLRTGRGEEIVTSVPVQIPVNAAGSLQLLVADATRLGAEDRRGTAGMENQPIPQIIRTLNRARRGNRLYVRLSAPDQGAVVNGEPMAALPPSVLAVLEADRQSGSFSALRSATRGEWSVPAEFAITGARQLTIQLER